MKTTNSEKPLIVLRKNSWHMRLNKWALGSLAPNPEKMFNYCPYFWLTIASLIISLFKGAFYPVVYFFQKLEYLGDKFIFDPLERKFQKQIQDYEFMKRTYFVWASERGDVSGWEYLSARGCPFWMKEEKFRNYLNKWISEEQNKTNLSNQEILEKWFEDYRKNRPAPKKPLKPLPRIEFFDNFLDLIGKFSDNFSDTVKAQANLIKYTKRFVGIALTAAFAVALYFILNWFGRFILYLIDIWDWKEISIVLEFIGIVVGCLAGIALFLFGVVRLLKWVEKNFSLDSKNWFIVFLIYFFYYPAYYFFGVFLWSWFIEGFLFKLLLMGLIIGGGKLIWSWFIGFCKIFKEYFGLAYTDYCPGIQWED